MNIPDRFNIANYCAKYCYVRIYYTKLFVKRVYDEIEINKKYRIIKVIQKLISCFITR